jgi:hypothetical protein
MARAETPEMKGIVVTAHHVYLPLDAAGDGRIDWKDVEETTKVVKRTRLKVPADLAKYLSERDQAEIL